MITRDAFAETTAVDAAEADATHAADAAAAVVVKVAVAVVFYSRWSPLIYDKSEVKLTFKTTGSFRWTPLGRHSESDQSRS